jgi:hypothetical protein
LGDKLSNGDLLYRLQWLIDDAQKITGIALELRNKILDGGNQAAKTTGIKKPTPKPPI